MGQLSFGTVIGRYLRPVAGGVGSERDTYGIPAVGLTFRFIPGADHSAKVTATPPVTTMAGPIVATTDSEGYLVGEDGVRGVRLVATDDEDLQPSGWSWGVAISSPGFKTLSFSFQLPADDGTEGNATDLTKVRRVAPNPASELAAWVAAVEAAQAAAGQAGDAALVAVDAADRAGLARAGAELARDEATAAAAAIEGAEATAEGFADAAAGSATAAGVARAGSEAARDSAISARDDAAQSRLDAAGFASAADSAADESGVAQAASETAQSGAITARTGAEAARDAADASALDAATARLEALGFATAANDSAIRSETARAASETARDGAVTARAGAEAARDLALAAAGNVIRGVGSPLGVVSATPGTIYVDTASTVGASVWRKASGNTATGWIVLHGDTSWRRVVSWDATGALTQGALLPGWKPRPGVAGGVFVRRRDSTVTVIIRHVAVAIGATNDRIWTADSGFESDSLIRNEYVPVIWTPVSTTAWLSHGLARGGNFNMPLDGIVASAVVEYPTPDPWPNALPGVPA